MYSSPTLLFTISECRELNGYEVAKILRTNPIFRFTVLVALTGYGSLEDPAEAIKVGFDHHYTKPLESDQLNEVLSLTREVRPLTTVRVDSAGPLVPIL